MLFRHAVHNARYVLKPRRVGVEQGIRVQIPGLAVAFANHYFDSRAAQAKYGWSDEERQLTERYLQSLPDFNRPFIQGKGGLYLDEQDAAKLHAANAERAAAAEANIEVTGGTCIYTVITPQGAEVCGDPLAAGSDDFCPNHLEVTEEVNV